MLFKLFQRFMIFGFTLVIILFFQAKIQAQTVCQIVPTSQISSIDQAKCLLRQPKIFGNVGPTLTSLPVPFDQLLTRPTIDISKEQLRRYLQAQGINEADIGGSLDKPVSRTNNNNSSAELARYFIIHDTSTPNFGNANFPNNINQSSWEFNNFNKYGSGEKSPAHIIINRVGESVTRKDFNIPWRSTKRESDQFCGVNKCKGLFLAVELVQPRKCQPNSGQTQCSPPTKNDAKSPDPGFTKAQLDRLAVVYIAASVRRGKWLIPAFHVVLDQIVLGGHDDPQNFNLDQWSNQLNDILTEIRS
ncbi:MAG: hypothetical protein IM504_00970 [Microcystis sp. M038S2]|uniref:hypothetical protein n=2 Tax=Microcystis TaxID=1125 RepID=UPI002588F9D6|nr:MULTISPECIES: hypothetical protein [unclassified Microcystis]MCA2684817.1 hypothetical protein [Microcystis sp. M046S2]MCA2703539.1 hypothetical protein [Microcystis sp. M038S2]MCA2948870.1 hypothetical protein [Microcystis sp. M109S1]MCA2950716.1 hypothetical protein [Microcystis sp. M112S1]